MSNLRSRQFSEGMLKLHYLFIKIRHPCTMWANLQDFCNSLSLIKQRSCPHISLRSELCHKRHKQGQVHSSSSSSSRSSSPRSAARAHKHARTGGTNTRHRYAEKWKISAVCGCFAFYDLFICSSGLTCQRRFCWCCLWAWEDLCQPLRARRSEHASLSIVLCKTQLCGPSYRTHTYTHTQCTALKHRLIISFNGKLLMYDSFRFNVP